jgi:hypothetical protein
MAFKKVAVVWKKIPTWIRGIFAIFIGWFFWGLFDSIIGKEALFNSLLKKIPSHLIRIKIPDIFIVLAFSALVIWLVSISAHVKGTKTNSRKEALLFANNAYWETFPLGIFPPKGPFCPKCYVDGKDIRMINTFNKANEVKCPMCDITVISWQPSPAQQLPIG